MAVTVLSEAAKALITQHQPGFIATADAAGRPNVSPKGSFRVLDDEHVVFADIHSPRTVANLRENPQVSAIVFDPETNHGCRVWGTAQIQESGELFDRVNEQLAGMNMQANHVIVIAVSDFLVF
jgi:predicted pyridoxine 5'-phosphate oxidase superfamily flavin-nucleotide-binding protein